MTQEKKQTAVEWLLFELSKVGYLPDGVPEEIHKKAIEMEREQIKEAYMDNDANYYSMDDTKTLAEHYYQTTYGKEAGS
jgi:HEPN domain-containing protein